MTPIDKIRSHLSYACLLLLFLVSLTLPAYAGEKDSVKILVVLSKDTQTYQKFNKQFQKTIAGEQRLTIKFHVIASNITKSILALRESGFIADYIVVAGTQAAKNLIAENIEAPTIFSLIPSSIYQQKIQSSPYCTVKPRCSAIYLEQPLDRQFSAIKQHLPDVRHLGVILGSSSVNMQDKIVRAGKKYDIEVNVELADEKNSPIVLSNRLSRTNDALLAFPDPDVYNRRTAKGILLSTYKHQTPFVGYSHGFVRAGALFSIYSTPEHIAVQTADMLIRTIRLANKELPKPEAPHHYKVEVNPAVMRSLRSKVNFNNSMPDNQ